MPNYGLQFQYLSFLTILSLREFRPEHPIVLILRKMFLVWTLRVFNIVGSTQAHTITSGGFREGQSGHGSPIILAMDYAPPPTKKELYLYDLKLACKLL